MRQLARYLRPAEAADDLRATAERLGASEIAVVRNLDYVYAPVEYYPLAPKVTGPLDRIAAFAVDMDGTSTTTEPLALHSLEYMVRRFTGRPTREDWEGLDPERDYPHIIGNSNFRHTEFLVDRYRDHLDEDALRAAFIESVLWTLSAMTDPQRRRDIRLDATNCGLSALLADPEFVGLAASGEVNESNAAERARPFVERHGAAFRMPNPTARIAAALDIYYYRYHSILRLVEQGQGGRLAKELLGEGGRHLVEPMPGYGVFFALAKGWLGEEAEHLAPELLAALPEGSAAASMSEEEARRILADLGRRFAEAPARIGLVTASIAYETHATIRAIFEVMREETGRWPISEARRTAIRAHFSDYTAAYDGFVNATDASEARLKPHRDLYTIALYQMSIPKEDLCRCIGLEDTEPGVISLRAAGIGCAVALPNHDTLLQNHQAAAHVVPGGLPELILAHRLLLQAETLH